MFAWIAEYILCFQTAVLNRDLRVTLFNGLIGNRLTIVAVVNVKEEPGTNTVSTSGVGVGVGVGVGSVGVGVPSGMMGSATSTGVSTTGFAPMEFQTRSKCFM